jgi:predicted transcriptional regulator
VEHLNRNEVEALRILWEAGAQKPADIQSSFGWPIENATLRSVLRGLVEQKLITRTKQGKAYFYRAKVSRESQLRRMVRRMADIFTGGSRADLILQMVRTERLSAEEIDMLRQMADGPATAPQVRKK